MSTEERKVIADISMSLDGYVAGEGAGVGRGLGDAPEVHAWVTDQGEVDTEILETSTKETGAVIMGRGLFDVVNAPDGWSTEMGYGADQVGRPPFVVVTHHPVDDARLVTELGLNISFVEGIAPAIDQAKRLATDGDVFIMGGGDVIGQAIEQGLADELRLHIAPFIAGGGTPLFKPGTRQHYRQRDVRVSRNAVHITYERTRVSSS
ncbi:MAG TPA: dihydrofolate reductase family protein [Acidimicrobiia bacterium]|nr:dihydrofolate reductase family protein [Acidimicrobiia bacterium]